MKPANFSRVASHFNPDEYRKQATRAIASRPAKVIFDVLSPMHSHLLNISLTDHLPLRCQPTHFSRSIQSYNSQREKLAQAVASLPDDSPAVAPVSFGPDLRCLWPVNRSQSKTSQNIRKASLAMPLGHHLVYFPLQVPGSALAPDGADADHCPGAPFVRRLWAGGSLTFSEGWENELLLDGRRAVCVETVEPPLLTAAPSRGGLVSSTDKVAVDVVRRYGPVRHKDGSGVVDDARAVGDARVCPVIQEVRKLVFLRESEAFSNGGVVAGPRAMRGKFKSPTQFTITVILQQKDAEHSTNRSKTRNKKKAIHEPELSFSLVPDAQLLFQFSALTFNAHAIHLDPLYARQREGHRNILVHGPLSLSLMLAALRARIEHPWRLLSLDYKNVAPLYAGEEVNVCLRASPGEKDDMTKKFNVWVEGPGGSLAVRGTAVAVKVPLTPEEGEASPAAAAKTATKYAKGYATRYSSRYAKRSSRWNARRAAWQAAKEVSSTTEEATTQAANEEAEATIEDAKAASENEAATAKEAEATTEDAEATAAHTEGAESTTEGAESTTKGAESTTEGDEATAKVAEATTEDAEATAAHIEDAEATTQGAEATVEDAEATAEDTEATAEDAEVTVEGEEATAEDAEATAEGAEATAEDAEAEARAAEQSRKRATKLAKKARRNAKRAAKRTARRREDQEARAAGRQRG